MAGLALVTHYDGTGEFNKHVKKAKVEISRLHYKVEKGFPFKKFVTKLKENFHVMSKDKSKAHTESKWLIRLCKMHLRGRTVYKRNVYERATLVCNV